MDTLDVHLCPWVQPYEDAPPHILRFGPMESCHQKPTGDPEKPWETISIQGGAIFSPCEVYRYVLWRVWDDTLPVWLFAMLNPSKATETEGDNTVDRQMERARRGGAGGIVVVNSGALRETDRLAAIRHPDPVGPDNAYWLNWIADVTDTIILAYGPDAAKWGGDKLVLQAFGHKRPQCLKITQNGSPGHPLYIGYNAPLIPYGVEP